MLVDIERAEPAGHVEIDLHGAALPVAADRVAQHIFEFWAVEGAFALVERPRPAGRFERLHQRGFGLVPYRVLADAFFRPVGEFDAHVVEAEILIDRQNEIVDLDDLRGDLLFGDEDVRVVLGEGAHPHQPVQRAGRLETVHLAEFGDLERQVAIGFQPVLENLDVAGAVHRLEHEGAVVFLARLHQKHRSRGTSPCGPTPPTAMNRSAAAR